MPSRLACRALAVLLIVGSVLLPSSAADAHADLAVQRGYLSTPMPSPCIVNGESLRSAVREATESLERARRSAAIPGSLAKAGRSYDKLSTRLTYGERPPGSSTRQWVNALDSAHQATTRNRAKAVVGRYQVNNALRCVRILRNDLRELGSTAQVQTVKQWAATTQSQLRQVRQQASSQQLAKATTIAGKAKRLLTKARTFANAVTLTRSRWDAMSDAQRQSARSELKDRLAAANPRRVSTLIRSFTGLVRKTTTAVDRAIESLNHLRALIAQKTQTPPAPTLTGSQHGPGGSMMVAYTLPALGFHLKSLTAQCNATGTGNNGGGGYSTTVSVGATSPRTGQLKIPGLVGGGLQYTCRSFLTTALGQSSWSNTTAAVPVNAITKPDTVTDVTLKPDHKGNFTVRFTPSASGGSPIMFYTVSCAEPGLPATTVMQVMLTKASFRAGLDTVYSCSITATNAFGTGNAATSAAVYSG